MAYSHKHYVGLTTKAPYAAVVVRRHFSGKIIVGFATQSERSLQVVLDALRAWLKKEFGPGWRSASIIALIEDSAAGLALAELAENAIPLGWSTIYRSVEATRQALESLLRVQAATAKLVIDEAAPNARELAQALDAKVEGGMYDALALCVYQAKEDDGFRSEDIKVVVNYDPPEWMK